MIIKFDVFSISELLHRVLKSGRWITIEFHNSSNSVWVAIQEALEQAGFVVADVRTLDKKQETYKQSIQKAGETGFGHLCL
ncbi:MAG: hypothetical protein R3A44_30975 [Caldilineaceae bacterium]